jgi:hypothetical protein
MERLIPSGSIGPTALKDIRGRNTERAPVAENSQRSQTSADQTVATSSYQAPSAILSSLQAKCEISIATVLDC